MQNNSQINWKYYPISVTAPDGVVLEGEIQYWAKDYKISLFYPLKLQEYCGHLQYAIPAVYVTDEPKRKGVVQRDLTDGIAELLLSLYEDKKEGLDANDVTHLIEEGYFDKKSHKLLNLVCKAWKVSEIDTVILEDLLSQRYKKELRGENT